MSTSTVSYDGALPSALVAHSAILPFSHRPMARRATVRGQAPHPTYLGISCGDAVRIFSLRMLYIEVFVYIDYQPLCDMPRSWSPFGPPRPTPFLVGGIWNLAGSWLVPASWAPRKFFPRGRQGCVRAACCGWKKSAAIGWGPRIDNGLGLHRLEILIGLSVAQGDSARPRSLQRLAGSCVNNPVARLLSTHPPGERRQSHKAAGP